MTERSRNIIVGFTAIAGLVGFGWLIMIFGEVPRWVKNTYAVEIRIDDAQGLAAGSRVKLNGVDIGEVDKIQLPEDPTQGVNLTAHIRSSMRIPQPAEVTASTGMLGGGAMINIKPLPPKEGQKITYLPTDGSGKLVAHFSSLTNDLAAMTRRMEQQFAPQFQNLTRVSDKIVEFADTYVALGNQMKALVEQRSPADVDAGKVAGNLSTILARADQRVADLKQAVDGLNKLLGDPKLQEQLRETVANARDMTANANKLAISANDKIDQLTRKLMSAADDLSKTLSSMDGLVTDARAGKGTMGKLMQDPAMYDNFSDAAAKLGDAIKDLRLLIQKWKAEGLPVHF
jgi:phospholipid/cholesterol/gamma-HCH transport system substrate-binding protein